MTILFQERPPLFSNARASSSSAAKPATNPQPPAMPAHQPSYQPPYPQAGSTTTPYPSGPIGMPLPYSSSAAAAAAPQPYSSPQPNQPPYPTTNMPGYQAPYQPYVNMPSPLSMPAGLDKSASSQNNSTQSLNKVGTNAYSGYNTIQPSHIRASLTSAIEDRLRQRLKELMGRVFEFFLVNYRAF